ncbi:hypothetical protein F4778DRAFT_206677 [Xylariomycetidae sp. FL2044]|nr:hypothetical protein F4778DRAFT_206677 [Xylariomycetidae sp. FL2044]
MCCGSYDDYDHPAPQPRPRPQQPYRPQQPTQYRPQQRPQQFQQRPQQFQPQHHRRQRSEQRGWAPAESMNAKQNREMASRQAAQKYGWPSESPQAHGGGSGSGSNRDSYIDPQVNYAMGMMPGVEMPAAYNPYNRSGPPPPPARRPTTAAAAAPRPPQRPTNFPLQGPARPSHHQQQKQQQHVASSRPLVSRQPPRQEPMSMSMSMRPGAVPGPFRHTQARRPVAAQIVRQDSRAFAPAQAAVFETCSPPGSPSPPTTAAAAPTLQQQQQQQLPKRTQIVRRDSCGVSECSDDDDDDNPATWRNYSVSPIQSPALSPRFNMHQQIGMNPGFYGKAF